MNPIDSESIQESNDDGIDKSVVGTVEPSSPKRHSRLKLPKKPRSFVCKSSPRSKDDSNQLEGTMEAALTCDASTESKEPSSPKRRSRLKLPKKPRSFAYKISPRSKDGSNQLEGTMEAALTCDESRVTVSDNMSKSQVELPNSTAKNAAMRKWEENVASTSKGSNLVKTKMSMEIEKEQLKGEESIIDRKKRKIVSFGSLVSKTPIGAATLPPVTSASVSSESSQVSASLHSFKSSTRLVTVDKVLSYVMSTMKPFTLNSLSTELGICEEYLRCTMSSLLDKEIIRKKVIEGDARNEIYWVDIDNGMKEMYGEKRLSKERAKSIKMSLESSRSKEFNLLRELDGVQSELSNNELDKHIDQAKHKVKELQKEVNETKQRISAAEKGEGKQLSKKKLQITINHMRVEWKSRKEKCVDFVDQLSDAMEKKPKEVIKLLDIETDEMVKEKLPPKHNINP